MGGGYVEEAKDEALALPPFPVSAAARTRIFFSFLFSVFRCHFCLLFCFLFLMFVNNALLYDLTYHKSHDISFCSSSIAVFNTNRNTRPCPHRFVSLQLNAVDNNLPLTRQDASTNNETAFPPSLSLCRIGPAPRRPRSQDPALCATMRPIVRQSQL